MASLIARVTSTSAGAALARGDDPGLARDLTRVLQNAGTAADPPSTAGMQDKAGSATEPNATTPAGHHPAQKGH